MFRSAFKLRETDDNPYYQGYTTAVIVNLPSGIAYGAYIMVYIASVYVLLSKPGFTSSPRRMSLFGITTLMFALGIIALVLCTTFAIQDAKKPDGSAGCVTCFYILDTTSFLMCIICDSICTWRTVIIWNKDKRVIGILVFFILVSAGFAGCNMFIQKDLFFGDFFFVLFAGLILVTNLLSTGLIAWRAWQRRIPVRDYLREGSGSLRFERVFALLIESGFIYCCIWILYTISMVVDNFPGPGFTLIVFVSGIYPTLIIILISKQMSLEHYSTHSTHSTEMQPTGVPRPGPLGGGSTP